MKKTLLALFLCIGPLFAEDAPQAQNARLWKLSLTTLAAANIMDARSSWGKPERNAALAGPNGRFGRDGALIKLALQGGLFGVEYLVARGHPTRKVYRALSFINFGAAAATGAVAAHNYTIGR
jgi:hypothetical protein